MLISVEGEGAVVVVRGEAPRCVTLTFFAEFRDEIN